MRHASAHVRRVVWRTILAGWGRPTHNGWAHVVPAASPDTTTSGCTSKTRINSTYTYHGTLEGVYGVHLRPEAAVLNVVQCDG